MTAAGSPGTAGTTGHLALLRDGSALGRRAKGLRAAAASRDEPRLCIRDRARALAMSADTRGAGSGSMTGAASPVTLSPGVGLVMPWWTVG